MADGPILTERHGQKGLETVMKRIAWPILLAILISACQSEGGKFSASPSPINKELDQSPPAVTSDGFSPTLVSSRPLETAMLIESTVPAAEPAAKQTEEISPIASPSRSPSRSPMATLKAIDEGDLPTEEPTVTPTVTVNGHYKGTYFRGLDSAPVTMIDYSDFL